MKDLKAPPVLADISPRRTATRSNSTNQRDALCLVGASVTGLIVPAVIGLRVSAGAGDGGVILEQFDALLNGFHVPQADPCGGRQVVPA